MPLCIDDRTTASHRPVFPVPAYLLVQEIVSAAIGNGPNEAEEPASEEALQAAVNLVVEVPFRLLGEADVSPFHGELHMSWTHGPKQVVAMCFADRPALIHHYMRIPGQPSEHDIERASPEGLAHWLEWLRA